MSDFEKLIASSNQIDQMIRERDLKKSDPMSEAYIDGVDVNSPPGGMADICQTIGDVYERRDGVERIRIIGAISIASVLAGRHLNTPSGGKVSLATVLVAQTGLGKSSATEPAVSLANKIGLASRVRSSDMTSRRQIQEGIIEGGGSLLYVVDDSPDHVKDWNNPKSPMGGTVDFFRKSASDSNPATMPATVRRLYREQAELSCNQKVMKAACEYMGINPQRNQAGEIDPKWFSTLNNDASRTAREAIEHLEMATKPIENMTFSISVAMTPERAKEKGMFSKWIEDGTLGRTFFLSEKVRTLPELKQAKAPEERNSAMVSLANEWASRALTSKVVAKYQNSSLAGYMFEYQKKIDLLNQVGGSAGSVASRYGQMIETLATLCAFMDRRTSSVGSVVVTKEHIDWAYQACIQSLTDIRDFFDGESEDDGLEITKWENIVSQARDVILNNTKFLGVRTEKSLSERLLRSKDAKEIFRAYNSSPNHSISEVNFIKRIIESIHDTPKHSPIEYKDGRIYGIDDNSWDNVPMSRDMKEIISVAMDRIRKAGGKKF